MQRNEAVQLIQQTFEASYDEGRFRRFIKEIFHTVEERDDSYAGTLIPAAYRDAIKSYKYLFKYTTPDQFKTEIAVFAVNVSNKHKLEKARSELRNFMAYVMKQRNKEVVLVAFYTDEDNKADWRFSFVRRESSYDFEAKKAETIISPAKRYSYLVGEKETSHTAKEQFVDLVVKERNNPTLVVLENAFTVEKVSKEFFDKYEELYIGLCDSMKAILGRDEKISHNFEFNGISVELFCKKLMGQIVFLYFIQKKGWLGVDKEQPWGSGDRRFLRTIFEDAKSKGKSYFNDYLEPLFYEALAIERDSHWYAKMGCKIPFLNGGLFDPVNNYDWVHTDINLPNKLFSNDNKDGILDVFDIYNFTVKEDEPLEKEVAIDPEMLGKVFENLLEVRDRKSKGAFYTPREIVHYMCQESLIHYLYSKMNKTVALDDISFFIKYGDTFSEFESKVNEVKSYATMLPDSIKQHAKAIDDALVDVKICDPAVGSGAFPVGLMHEIIRARQTLLGAGFVREAKNRNIYEYKRQVIQNSIYGVDIEESAVEIAKLRLWLSLIVDEDDINNIKPLPNLDYKIVCGNSLQRINDRDMFKFSALQELEALKIRFFDATSKTEKRNLNKQISDIFNLLTEDGKIFDFKIYFSEIFKTEKSERNYELSNTMFDDKQMELSSQGAEYGKGGGFDIVIGNPPYIDSEAMVNNGQEAFREYIVQNYPMARGNFDIYIAFFNLGFNLLSQMGVLTYITPDKWLNKGFGEALRETLLKNIYAITQSGNVFESARVDSIITFIAKEKVKTITSYTLNKTELVKLADIQNSTIQAPCQLDFIFSNGLDLVNKIDKSAKRVRDYALCESACATSDAYLLKDILISDPNPEYKYYKIANTGTINKYAFRWGVKAMKYLKDDYMHPVVDISKFNTTFKGAYARKSEKPKIIIKGMTLLDAAIDNTGSFVAGKSTLVICDQDVRKLKYLSAVINSKITIYYLWNKYPASSYLGGLTFNKDMLNNFPVPDLTEQQQTPFVDLVEQIIKVKESNPLANTSDLEYKIDELVYKLYDLTPEEIATVEGK